MPKPLIHADIDASEFGRNYPPDLSVEADAKVFLMRLLEVLQGRGFKAARTVEKETKATKNRALDVMRQQHPEEFRMLDDVRAAVPRDGIVAVQSMLGHWCRFALDRYQPSSFLFANSYGSMGFAFHAAIGAKIAAPDRSVVAFCGDGGFMMGCGEMATLAQYDLGIPVVIVNNGGFAILRERQKKNFSRTIGTDLFNPDFVTFARSFGIDGCRINDLDAFGPALSKAVNDGKPYMIEVPVEFKDYRGGQIQ